MNFKSIDILLISINKMKDDINQNVEPINNSILNTISSTQLAILGDMLQKFYDFEIRMESLNICGKNLSLRFLNTFSYLRSNY